MASAPDLDGLAKFISKALEIQLSDPDEPLTEEALAKIARNAGLSDDDWKRVCSLVLKSDGTAMHTEWPREGRWLLDSDGSIKLAGPTGSFRIDFRDGMGHVIHLQRGGTTTIVPKNQMHE